MERAGRDTLLLNWCWFLAFGLASSVWCVTAAWDLGATFDEPIYVERGLEHWHTGSYHGLLKLGTMPLAIDLQTLPIYLWERCTGKTLDAEAGLDQLLPWARAATLLFWWLLLTYTWWAGRLLAGDWGGRLAVAFVACEPSLLAHAGLATTDLAVTACLLALVYHFYTGREHGWLRRVGLPALWFGIAVLAKASGLVFGPLCMLAVEVERRLREQRRQGLPLTTFFTWPALRHFSPWGAFGRDALQVLALGLVLVFVYCGSDWHPEPAFVAWAHGLPDGPGARTVAWLADHLCIFPNAGDGIVRQVRHNVRGHGTYLLGVMRPRAIWYYFPVALSIKLSLTLLLLPVLLLVTRARTLVNWACVTVVALLVFSLTCRVQIGVRFFLLLMVLLSVGLAAAVAEVCRRAGWRRVLLTAGVTYGLLWTAVCAVVVWPHGLCYTNELWGGSRTGYLCLSDSNYDWGQGLHELAEWQRSVGLPELDVWYFGTDPLIHALPMRALHLHDLPIKDEAGLRAEVRGRYLAVGTSLLYGMPCDTPSYWAVNALLHGRRPVARTPTFFIYDLREPAGEELSEPETPGPGRRKAGSG
jgi:hypothetical protein